MNDKIRVGIICGGKSAEHEVSLQSAKSIIEAIDRDKYEVVIIGIGHDGRWQLNDRAAFLLNAHDPKSIALQKGGQALGLIPGEESRQIVNIDDNSRIGQIDVVFPILHGPYGEDGTIQGLLRLANLPFVGADVLGSAVGMDKDVMKRLLRDAGIPVGDFVVCTAGARDKISYNDIAARLGTPLFIKPANLGSSVGISKANNRAEFEKAIDYAFEYDTKVIVEAFIKGREIECAVLGNDDPIASVPGEIVPQHDFYSYEAKYLDDNGALLQIPAKLTDEQARSVQGYAIRTFQALCCSGLGRVDMFLTGDNRILVNEINTLPGFTNVSMYPKLWAASGIPYAELIDRLIRLAIERFERSTKLKIAVEK